MSLETNINEKLKVAMLAKDQATVRGLRDIKAAILLAKTSEGGKEGLTEEEEMKMLQKMLKQRKDSLEIFQQQNRADLAQKEQEEINLIASFLPQPMDEATLRAELAAVIAEVGAKTPADLGKVMGVASKKFAGKADGKAINTIVRELLSSGQ
jgi:uncharacterized protein YqeY